MRITPIFLFTLALILFLGIAGMGQNIVEADGNACEINSLYADTLHQEIGDANKKIFIIVHPVIGESDYVAKKRLSLLRSFLHLRKGFERYNPIYAIGDKIKEEGKIEVYVGNELYWVIKTAKNRGPCMDCCDHDLLSDPGNLLPKKKRIRK